MQKKTKICSRCKKEKSLSDFGYDKRRLDKANRYCRKCCNEYKRERYKKSPGKFKKAVNKWRKNNPNKVKKLKKDWELRNTCGITLKQQEEMYIEQKGKCDICGKKIEGRNCHTDHNHKTGKVRALLCCRCNLYVGFVENEKLILKIRYYLKKHDS